MNPHRHLLLISDLSSLAHINDLFFVTTMTISILTAFLRVESLNDNIKCFLMSLEVFMSQILCATQRRLNH